MPRPYKWDTQVVAGRLLRMQARLEKDEKYLTELSARIKRNAKTSRRLFGEWPSHCEQILEAKWPPQARFTVRFRMLKLVVREATTILADPKVGC